MDLVYTGIGSRKTPTDILEVMTLLACMLAEDGWLLRSGGAAGADSAFEEGCLAARGRNEIYWPWPKFNTRNNGIAFDTTLGQQIAAEIHPAWKNCSPAAKKLHGRNVYQVLGWTMDAPSKAVVCWTSKGELRGGTSTALVLAQHMDIPIFNLGSDEAAGTSAEELFAEIIRLR
jgi:hypothetical protein